MQNDIYFNSSPLKKQDLKLFYETSDRYLAELSRHDEKYLENYIKFVSKYTKGNLKILDLGCGNGMSTYLLNKLGKGLLTIGCDISFKFLKNSLNFKMNNLTYLVADVTNLPFKNEQMDIVSCFQLIEHITEIENFLCEIIRVVKKDGMIIIMSPNLLSPFPPLRGTLNRFFNKKKNKNFSNSLNRNLYLCAKNAFLILDKIRSKDIKFLFRKPLLDENELRPDSDSVYLANQVDVKKFLKKKGFKVINIATGMSFMGTILAKSFPNFSGEIGIVAQKVI